MYRNIAFFGAPGVGKGTYGKLISKEFKIPVFSMGDYFRRVINDADTQGQEDKFITNLKETLKSGKFVDDELVMQVLQRIRYQTFKDSKFVLFDGVPRTIKQAEMMQREMPIDFVLNFTTPNDIILEKLMGRRVCPTCDRNYNVAAIDRNGYFMKPLLPKISEHHCEECGDGKTVKLVLRDDDKKETVSKRMDLYYEKTEPILEVFR